MGKKIETKKCYTALVHNEKTLSMKEKTDAILS